MSKNLENFLEMQFSDTCHGYCEDLCVHNAMIFFVGCYVWETECMQAEPPATLDIL